MKKKMKQVDVNWSEYIRECVQKKIDQEKRGRHSISWMKFENVVSQHQLKKLWHGSTKAGSDNLTSNYVVAACIVVKWLLLGESYQENTDRLKEDLKYSKTEMFAPSFMTQEVAKALWSALKLGRITQEDAQKRCQILMNYR